MKYKVQIPKILCLVLIISKFAKDKKYFNTNDLIKIANEIKPELVRLRKDKTDYKYFDDTNFGGLRGNFSTVLTLRGLIKRNNNYTPYYGIGKNERLFNAIRKGEIILDTHEYFAYTNNYDLKRLLEQEARNLSIRESQAHIKKFLKHNRSFPLTRDSNNFPKLCVLKSDNNQYFFRMLFNTYISDNIIEYNLYNYLAGPKVKQYNMHPLFVIPNKESAWAEFYAIDSQEVLDKTPLLLKYNIAEKKFYDEQGNLYNNLSLDEAIKSLSDENGNIEARLSYNWSNIRAQIATDDIQPENRDIQEEEFSVFLNKFLNWKKEFTIYDKKVVQINVSSSGGADVILTFAGGTCQNLELEHKWNNYILHQHHKNSAWKNCWIYADEEFDFEKIKQIFIPLINHYRENIPTVFLTVDENGKKVAYEVDWDKVEYKKIKIGD